MRIRILAYALALAVAAATPLVGTAALGFAAVLLLLVLAAGRTSSGRPALSTAGAGAALLGGLVGVAGAVDALALVGATEPYGGRLGFGIAALALAVVAGSAPLFARARPAAGAAVTVLAGGAGCVAMAAFYLNTYYFAALPLWLLGAALILTGGASRDQADGRGPANGGPLNG